ncbi:hypothetical protein [Enterocloster citroniae]|uniref:hypothetical protein n=1 Tax=Enterocloster citroniae TaxID=358743 RepID=UPI0022E631CA|nr:hypothetical protein [Enterocloster citroniae]
MPPKEKEKTEKYFMGEDHEAILKMKDIPEIDSDSLNDDAICGLASEMKKFFEAVHEMSIRVGKVFANVGKKYVHRNMSNNWLKQHGLPMRRKKR